MSGSQAVAIDGRGLRARAPSEQSRRILHVINNLALGGTQNLLLRTVRELGRRGWQSHICVLEEERRTANGFRDELDISYLDFHGDYRKPLALRRCCRRLEKQIESYGPAVVHSYLWTSDFVSAIAAHRRRVPHLCHIVDRREWQTSSRQVHRVRRWATRRAFRRAGTRFVAVSRAAKDYACQTMGHEPDRIDVACNGIDVENIAFRDLSSNAGSEARRLRLGTASRLESEKGIRFLIESLHVLLQAGHDLELLITGEGNEKAELQSLVTQFGMNDRVTFVGWVPDVLDFYEQLDVFVVPSIAAEGLPTTILEAMAAGCIVIASDVGGASEVIAHGVSGYLVSPSSASDLAEQIAAVKNSPSKTATMRRAARQRIESHFSTRQMVDVIVQQYETLLATHSR